MKYLLGQTLLSDGSQTEYNGDLLTACLKEMKAFQFQREPSPAPLHRCNSPSPQASLFSQSSDSNQAQWTHYCPRLTPTQNTHREREREIRHLFLVRTVQELCKWGTHTHRLHWLKWQRKGMRGRETQREGDTLQASDSTTLGYGNLLCLTSPLQRLRKCVRICLSKNLNHVHTQTLNTQCTVHTH